MQCPHCHKEISKQIVNREFGKLGGKKSRRTLSSEDASRMARIRHNKHRLEKTLVEVTVDTIGNDPNTLMNG